MTPSRYQLPQYVSEDRRRAREDTLRRMCGRFELEGDLLKGLPEPGYARLPAGCRKLPSEAQFTMAKQMELVSGALRTMANGLAVKTMSQLMSSARTNRRYRAVFRMVQGPTSIMNRWREDAEFGRQRLCGVNPMQIRLLREKPPGPLWEAARSVLENQAPKQDIEALFKEERLFFVDYGVLWHPRVQSQLLPAPSPRRLAAPTCLFWTNERGTLLPLAIQLKPASEPDNPVFTPLGHSYNWLLARAHVTVADTHLHEGVYHLLETHLVSGAVALCIYRRLHPDHPLRQLLEPHYEYTLAINKLAETRLINRGGAVDTALTAGVAGTFEAMRLHYAGWSFSKRSLKADLAERGVDKPGTLPHYYYREDSLRVHSAIAHYVKSILELWYKDDGDVMGDSELQAWAAELASETGGNVPGFPPSFTSRPQLFETVTELLFRAGPQHAAVNNGQFDAYGFIPNMPGRLDSKLLANLMDPPPLTTEAEFWKTMPDSKTTMAQMGMVWVLSAPTVRTLLHSGESPAFHPSICADADEIIGGFRRQLSAISAAIQRRNAGLDVAYRYLDPQSISRSTDI